MASKMQSDELIKAAKMSRKELVEWLNDEIYAKNCLKEILEKYEENYYVKGYEQEVDYKWENKTISYTRMCPKGFEYIKDVQHHNHSYFS